MASPHLARVHAAAVPDLLTFDVWVLTQLTDEIAGSSKIPASSLANPRCGSTSETGDCARQNEAARGCGRRGVLWEFNRFLPEKPCQTGILAKTRLLIFTM